MPSATVYCCGVNANPSCGPAGVVGLSEKGASIKIKLSKHGEWRKSHSFEYCCMMRCFFLTGVIKVKFMYKDATKYKSCFTTNCI